MLCAQGATQAAGLPASVSKLLKTHRLPASALSVVVTEVAADKPRISFNAAIPRIPASTIKAVTSWAALDVLGPAHTWETKLYTTAKIKAGVLKGDLVIKGGGDPYMVLEELWKMLGALRETGLREIHGDLVIDDSAYILEPNTPGEFDGGTYRLYNVIPTAFTVNFNAVRFLFNARTDKNLIAIRTVPKLPNLSIKDEIKRSKLKCASRNIGVQMHLNSPTEIRFSGKLPIACSDYELSRSVMQHTDYAFGAFKSIWAHWGGNITGVVRRGKVPAKQAPLLVWTSRPLAELLRPVNKWSNNVMARLLLYSVGAAKQALPVSREQAASHLKSHLRKRGLDVSQFVMDNGSGLSRQASLTADFMATLLKLAWHQPTMPEFVSSMSIPGLDGTMKRRFQRRSEVGKMHIKTGWLRDVTSAVGYVHAKSGKVFAVAMLLNHARTKNGSGKALQDAILKWTYAQ
jgi:serine-type D-Ala-D-Ala carboxypeptidase/endopeptidase (penicillin-binding protein 4)